MRELEEKSLRRPDANNRQQQQVQTAVTISAADVGLRSTAHSYTSLGVPLSVPADPDKEVVAKPTSARKF